MPSALTVDWCRGWGGGFRTRVDSRYTTQEEHGLGQLLPVVMGPEQVAQRSSGPKLEVSVPRALHGDPAGIGVCLSQCYPNSPWRIQDMTEVRLRLHGEWRAEKVSGHSLLHDPHQAGGDGVPWRGGREHLRCKGSAFRLSLTLVWMGAGRVGRRWQVERLGWETGCTPLWTGGQLQPHPPHAHLTLIISKDTSME